MSILPAHRPGLVPDLNTLWHALAHAGLGSSTGTHLLAVEDSIDNGRYVVRAEIPGVDPDKDVEVSVEDRQLTIKAPAQRTAPEQRTLRVSPTARSLGRSAFPKAPTQTALRRPVRKGS